MYEDLLFYEKKWWGKGYQYLMGVDEVGRGSLAGPVVVGGIVISQSTSIVEGVTDSKKISAGKRSWLVGQLNKSGAEIHIGEASAAEIDELGIVPATEIAIQRMMQNLQRADAILLDGNFSETFKESLQLPVRNYIKGDEKSYSIGAASIVAKVFRDNLMLRESDKYPEYKWSENKGYGTKEHREAIAKYGLSPDHRKSFCNSLI